MKDEMLEYMTEASRLRTQNIRCIAIRNRRVLVHTAYVTWRTTPENLSRYPADSPMPNPADVLEFPPIERLIHTDTNIELDMDRDIMPCIIRALPSEIAEWREKVASALWIKMLESRVWAEAGWWHEPVRERRWEWRLRFLERAVVVFRCKDRSMHCRWEQARLRADVVFPAGTPNVTLAIALAADNQDHAPVMWHPQFVHHQCTSMTFQGYVERITRTYESLSVEREHKQCRHAPWDAKTLVFDEQASRATRNILEACGMDWRETTTKQLDQRNPRLACLKCSFGARCDGERPVRVWTWRDAVSFGSLLVLLIPKHSFPHFDTVLYVGPALPQSAFRRRFSDLGVSFSQRHHSSSLVRDRGVRQPRVLLICETKDVALHQMQGHNYGYWTYELGCSS
jgi:hypothetical protein